MKSKDGFVQAYNGQIAVDAQAQVIVAHDVTQSAADSGQLLGMADAVEANLGRKPEQASADAGYCSEANLAGLEERKIDRRRVATVGSLSTGPASATASGQAAGPGRRRRRRRSCLPEAFRLLGIDRPIVVAHSWGTLVALALALDQPRHVSGLVLVSGYYCPTPRTDVALFSPPALPLVGDIPSGRTMNHR